MNVMNATHHVTPGDLTQFKPLVQQMEKEGKLEVNEDSRSYYSHYGNDEQVVSRLPFVRVFSLDTKRYVFADIDDVTPYEFATEAMSRLHLPDNMLSILTRVFNTPTDKLFGDLIDGKHGGVVVLASGNPGVGKTLTAEVYSEQTERPLYVLELGELGTNVEQVEENLGPRLTPSFCCETLTMSFSLRIFAARSFLAYSIV